MSILQSVIIMQASIVYITAIMATLAYAQGAAAPSLKDKIAAIGKKCASESGIPADKAALAFNQELPQNDNERCFLDCMYRSINVIENDKFSIDGSMKLVHARFQKPEEVALATKLIETCNKEVTAKDGEKCTFGRVVRECFVNHGKTVNFFPSAA